MPPSPFSGLVLVGNRGFKPLVAQTAKSNSFTPSFSRLAIYLVALLVVFAFSPARAQDESAVTADEVNAVARQMYCPVCENIPLDVCGTAACIQWRDEIRSQLAEGKTPTQVIAAFVQRYGDKVVGTPQDPTLRALSLVTPWLVGAVAVLVALYVLWRWRRASTLPRAAPVMPAHSDDEYRARLERDLQSRR
jgi:cytochrome c-type biogenesis protein CcmH